MISGGKKSKKGIKIAGSLPKACRDSDKKTVKKVLYKHINNAVLQAAEDRNSF